MTGHDDGEYPVFPDDWDEWDYNLRQDFLEDFDLLTDDWEDMSGDEREEYLDNYDAEQYESDVEGAGGEIDEDWTYGEEDVSTPIEQRRVDREAILEEFDIDLNIDQLFIDSELELVGPNPTSTIVAGIEVPGVHAYTISGKGFESQYLRELQGSDGEEEFEAAPGQQPENGAEDEDPDGGEEPPLEIGIEAVCAQGTAQQLANLRRMDELFEVAIGDEVFEDMELANFERTLTGEQPFAYECLIEVREWREIEVDLEGDDASGGEFNEAEDAEEVIEDWDESGEPGEPTDIEVPEGETRTIEIDERQAIRNTTYNVGEGGEVVIYADGDDWLLESISFEGEGEARIQASGSGVVRNIYIPGGEESIEVAGDDVEIENVNVTNSPLERAITAVDDILEPAHDLDFYVPPDGRPRPYETVTLAPDEHRVVRIEAAESHTRTLYDCSEDGAHVTFECSGFGWELSDIGVIGTRDSEAVVVKASESGGRSRIENCYFFDAVADGISRGETIKVDEDTRGQLTIERVYLQEAPDRAIDATGVEGTVRVRNCYSADADTHVAISGGRVENTVCVDGETAIHATPPHIPRDEMGLESASGSDEHQIIWNEGAGTIWGEIYKARIEFSSTSNTDVGLLFGVQPETTDWSDYTGYLAWFDSDNDKIIVGRYDDGTVENAEGANLTWPTGEELIAEIDYRSATTDAITFAVYHDGTELASTTIYDITHDFGFAGFYRFHADAGWRIDGYQYVDMTTVHNCELLTEEETAVRAGVADERAVAGLAYTNYEGALVESGGSRIESITTNTQTPDEYVPVGCPSDAVSAAQGVGERNRGQGLEHL